MIDTFIQPAADVMLVCRNGHVITDRLRASPESGADRCDRCGAATLSHCPTCAQAIPGANHVPGLVTLGHRTPPAYCSLCGAAYPWTRRLSTQTSQNLATLETLLRRVPRSVRQLRTRYGTRPPFRVEDERDLEDLLRALLPLAFDDVRPECRTPSYASCTRTDFLILPEQATRFLAVTVKRLGTGMGERLLETQWQEDVRHYEERYDCRALIACIYDPESLLRDAATLETAWSRPQGDLDLRAIVAS
jgi:hypothetical protein